jgi:tellurite resistance protein TerC
LRKVLPITQEFQGAKIRVTENGKKFWTPMIIVFLALGTTDLIFALDSIPAIFGLTREPFIVFTANVFALMGLRQLYFLLGGLLQRLVYLSIGLAVILAFIGVKLVMEALHDNSLPFINGGEPIEAVPHIPIWLSLSIILGVLVLATIASLLSTRGELLDVEEPAAKPEEAGRIRPDGPAAPAGAAPRIDAEADGGGPGR